MNAPLRDDAGHRRRATTDLDTTFLVEASAGTGKTTILVERIVSILRSGRAGLREIAAITFTEKAAGELQLRLRRRLQEERLDRALQELPFAPISTIHAFASDLLRERPVEARCDPAFRVTDELQEELRLGEAWREWEEEAFGRPDPALETLLGLGADARELGEAAKIAARNRDVVGSLALEGGATVEGAGVEVAGADGGASAFLVEQVVPALHALARHIAGWEGDCRDPADHGLAQMRSFGARWRALDPHAPDTVARWLLREGLPKRALGDKGKWRTAATLKAYKDRHAEVHALQSEYRARVHHAALAAWFARLDSFLAEYEARRRGSGRLDFQDLLLFTRDLLRDDRAVRAWFQERFRYILVDEFQDTDPLQAEIVFFLAEAAPRAADWREVQVAPGKLFLVGDPKQSIYRFRRADIEVYQEARAAILAQPGGGEVLALTQNFRSAPPLLDWVNLVFSGAMVQRPGEAGVQPEYSPLVPSPRTQSARGEVRILAGAHLEGAGDPPRIAEIVRREARLVASAADALVQAGEPVRGAPGSGPRPVRFGDMALLLASTTHLEAFESALAARGVPYARSGGRGFYQRTEIHTVLSLLRALDNPLDTGSLVAALRSPAFGVSDEELFAAAREGALASASGGPATVAAALATLEALRARRGELGTASLLEEALRLTDLVTVLAVLPDAEQRIANVRKVARIARALESEGPVTPRRMARDLTDLFDSASKEAEAACVEEGDDALRIMTVHAAKGLEFPVVFLAGLASAGREQTRFPSLLVDRGRGRFAFALKSGFATRGFDDLHRREEEIEKAETVRLFYVAATRARDLLYLADVPDRKRGHAKIVAAGFPAGAAAGAPSATRVVREAELPPQPVASRWSRYDALGEAAAEDDVAALLRLEQAWRTGLDAARAAASASVPVVRPSRLKASEDRYDADETTPADDRAPMESGAAGFDPRDSPEARAVGSLVHETLARAFEQDDDALRERVRLLAGAARLSSAAAARAGRLITKALGSPTVARARRSPRRLTECPFACWTDGVLVEGRVDLLFEEEGRLVLVDYKTDDVRGETLAERARLYRPSLAAYADAARKITGMPVAACLHFLDAGALVPLDTL